MTELFTENLPPVRCAPSLKVKLEKVVNKSLSRKVADHIRFAVEQYVDRELPLTEDETTEPLEK